MDVFSFILGFGFGVGVVGLVNWIESKKGVQ